MTVTVNYGFNILNMNPALHLVAFQTNETLMALNRMADKNLAVFVDSLNDTEVLLTYAEQKNYVYVRDKPAISHLIYDDYKYRKTLSPSEKVHCAFAVAKEPFLKRRRTFAYSENFQFQSLFDHELLHLVEAGIVKYKLLENLPRAEICPNNLGSTERQLRNGDLMMTYYVMLTGFCTSIVVFVTEMIFRMLNRRSMPANGGLKAAKSTTLLGTVTPPPPYATLFNRNRILTGSDLMYVGKVARDNGGGKGKARQGGGTGLPATERDLFPNYLQRDFFGTVAAARSRQSRIIGGGLSTVKTQHNSDTLFQYAYTN